MTDSDKLLTRYLPSLHRKTNGLRFVKLDGNVFNVLVSPLVVVLRDASGAWREFCGLYGWHVINSLYCRRVLITLTKLVRQLIRNNKFAGNFNVIQKGMRDVLMDVQVVLDINVSSSSFCPLMVKMLVFKLFNTL